MLCAQCSWTFRWVKQETFCAVGFPEKGTVQCALSTRGSVKVKSLFKPDGYFDCDLQSARNWTKTVSHFRTFLKATSRIPLLGEALSTMRIHELAAELNVDSQTLREWLAREGFIHPWVQSVSAEITNGRRETVLAAFNKCGGKIQMEEPQPKPTSRGPVSKKQLLAGAATKMRNPAWDWLGTPKKGQSLRSPNKDFGDWIEDRRNGNRGSR